MPCSRPIISDYAAWFCVGVSTGGVPCHYGPGLDGNDLLLSLWLYSFNLYLILVVCSGTSALIWGGVFICIPWYVLVVYVWDIGGHILFSGACIQLYIGDYLFSVLEL